MLVQRGVFAILLGIREDDGRPLERPGREARGGRLIVARGFAACCRPNGLRRWQLGRTLVEDNLGVGGRRMWRR